MNVCHLITHNPHVTAGGIETVAEELGKVYDIKWLGSGGAMSLPKGFLMALRLRFSKYDVIHIHDNSGYWCTWLARNKKLLYTCHGFWKEIVGKLDPPQSFMGKLKAIIVTRMQSRIIKKSNAVVPITSNIKKILEEEYGILPFRVIQNGVDTEKFRPIKSRKPYDYIWVGTNPKGKRLYDAIKFARGKNKKIAVVGTSGDNTSHAVFLGKVKSGDMPALYNNAKFFIYFNTQKEPPIAMLEAMSCGLGVITNDYIIGELTPSYAKKGLLSLGGEKANVATLDGKRARSVAENFDWRTIRSRYADIYEKLKGR